MQTQQHRPVPKPKQRLNAGEVVVALVNFLLGCSYASGGFDLLRISYDVHLGIAAGTTLATGLGAGLAALLIALHQRRLAVYAQWFAAIAAIVDGGLAAWLMVKEGLPTLSLALSVLGSVLAIALLFAWFAWFLKRMDESE